MNDPFGHRLKRFAGEGLLDSILDDFAYVDDFPNFRH